MIARAACLMAGVAAAAVLLGGCVPQDAVGSSAPASTSSTVPAVSPATVEDVAVENASTPAGTTSTMVTRVIDGDTFVVGGGTKVRVLGIDSCEAGTPGGTRATRAAEDALLGQAVRLAAQPGVDLDRYGRQLRYVSYAGGDFAEMMVRADHTAIYTGGRNDASAAVQARLRGLDGNGRTCGTATTTRATAPTTRPAPAVVGTPKPKPSPRPAAAAPKAPTASSGSASYPNCTAARAAGVTPLYRGQPGYAPKLDRDGDGIACE